MRTYEDTFSGQKIYPGKVRSAIPTTTRAMSKFRRRAATPRTPFEGTWQHNRGNTC